MSGTDLANNEAKNICTVPDRIALTKACALVSAVVVVNSRLFVTPNVRANRHFAAGWVWARLLKPKPGPPQRVRLSEWLGRCLGKQWEAAWITN